MNTSTLNLYVRVVDLGFGGSAGSLVIEQSYNSDSGAGGPLGNGWSFSVGDTLTQGADSSWTLLRGSGRIDRFGQALDPTQFFAVTATNELLTRNADGSFSLRNPQTNTLRTFDASGHLTAIVDAGLTRVLLRYSGGRLIAALPRGSSGRPVQFNYAGDGHISAITDQAGRSVSFSYDGSGNLVQQTSADGSTISYSYDGTGRLIGAGQTTIAYGSDADFSAVAAITLADGTSRQYTAPGGRQVQVIDGAGNATLYTSTAAGQTSSIADAAGNLTAYTYDAGGRRTSTTNANGTVQFAYDGSGNLTLVTDPVQSHWSGAYNGSSLTQFTDAGNNAWKLTYDSAGRLNAVADPYGNALTATRNGAGLVTAVSDANGGRNGFQYDADGVVTNWLDPLGGNWKYQYDGALNVSARTEPAGNTMQATYDAQSRLKSVTSPAGSVSFDYSGIQRDAMNRVAQTTDSFGNQIGYSYNLSGSLAAITLPGGNMISYQYDATGRLARVTDWLGDFAIYKYDATGLVTSISISAGPVTAYQYDKASNLTALVSSTASADNGVAAAYRYTTDANGNRLSISAADPSSAPLAITAGSLTYNLANQVTGSSAGRTYRYDSSLRLQEIDGTGTTTFGYDAAGRVAAAGGTQYGYDGTGLRVERDTPGGARRFVYDLSRARPRLAMETDGANNPVAWYVWGLGVLWKISGDGKIYFYHFDADGNVVAVSSATSGIVNRYRYDPLGNLMASDESVENDLRARGQSGWVDDGNGLLYGDGNFYVPELRRTLAGLVSLDPPAPRIVPAFAGPGACFVDGVAKCAISSGRRTQ